MQVRERAEQRFLDRAVVEEEPEVRVVADHDELLARVRGGEDGLAHGVDFGRARHVAGRVVREVQHQDLLRGSREQRLAHGRHVEVLAVVGREGLDHAAEARLEVQRVVVPEHVRNQHAVAGIDEQIADERQAVRDRVRDDRQAESALAQRRILGQQLLLPGLAQIGPSRCRRVAQRVRRRDVLHVREHRRQRHRAVALGRLADRRVEAVGFLFRLGRLGEDALREVELAAALGQQLVRDAALGADLLIEFVSEGVHRGAR